MPGAGRPPARASQMSLIQKQRTVTERDLGLADGRTIHAYDTGTKSGRPPRRVLAPRHAGHRRAPRALFPVLGAGAAAPEWLRDTAGSPGRP
jgi:hypothetical protein